MHFINVLFIPLIFLAITSVAQDEDSTETDKNIRLYDAFNEVLGGDSVRLCNGQPCSGLIKDYHDNGELKHKGYYSKGRLTTTFKNYFDNGQLEREFKQKNANKAELTIYYDNGQLRSEITYWKGGELEWKEYGRDGKMEFYELYDKSLEFLEVRTYFHDNGNKQSHLELVDKKNKMYEQLIYYSNGVIKGKGKVLHNPFINAYRRTGEWIFFDENGNPEVKQEYVKGKVINEEEL